MSIVRRIALVLKSCLSSTGERLDRIAAEEERRDAESLKKALEEVKSAQAPSSRLAPSSAATASRQASPEAVRLASDYRLLGVSPGSDLNAVEAAWRNLAARADPKRFPAGSDEEKRAAELLNSINQSYARIRAALNPTEGRFGQLEL